MGSRPRSLGRRAFALRSIVAFSLVACACALPARVYAQSADEVVTGTGTLPESHASFVVPAGVSMMTGSAAHTFAGFVAPNLNAEGILTLRDGSIVFLSYVAAGYLSPRDLRGFDAGRAIAGVRRSDAPASPPDRSAPLVGAPVPSAWLIRPTADTANGCVVEAVRWSYHPATFDEGDAFCPGRFGYEKIAVIATGRRGNVTVVEGLAHGFHFLSPARIRDVRSDDRAAGFGFVALVNRSLEAPSVNSATIANEMFGFAAIGQSKSPIVKIIAWTMIAVMVAGGGLVVFLIVRAVRRRSRPAARR